MSSRREDESMSTREAGRMGGQAGGHKGGEAALHSEKVSAAELAMYLKGIDFPADKKKIVSAAKSNGAPENVMQYLNNLPEKSYQYPTDIEQEFGKMK
jgi:hypothetical protein